MRVGAPGRGVGGPVVLTLGKLGHGQQQYYLDTVAKGAEEYYVGGKEPPGQWVGNASRHLNLVGEVDGDQLGRLLAHVDPSGVYRLTGARSVPTIAAFDATFCVPKSVSLLYALGDPEISNQVRNATDVAVTEALAVYERAAARVRRGKGGHTVRDADGLVAAAFRHRTSRAGDPHLHTHVVIANLGHEPVEDRWSALDGRPVYRWASTIGHLHEAQLRWELTQRLGVEWGPVVNGIADVEGIPRSALREFSTRRREIEAHLDEHGQHGARAAQVAAYATRHTKKPEQRPDGLLPEWRARAYRHGLNDRALAAVVDRSAPVPDRVLADAAVEALYRRLATPTGLTARRSTFDERDVIKAICNQLPCGAPVQRVLALADGFLCSAHAIPVRVEAEPGIQLADGTTVAGGVSEVRYTTPEMLAVEADLLAGAVRRRHTHTAIAAPSAVEAAIRARPTLTAEQQAMVRAVCRSGDGVDIVEGVAGAGKTFALAAAREAWEASGYRVLGCALAARAAQQLSDDAGIPALTIERLLGALDRRRIFLDADTVLMVDEAGMVGTRKLARLLTHIERDGTKVLLVGDPWQLPEIDAGGAFRGLRARLGSAALVDNRRQQEAWEREALAELRAGDTDDALDRYVAHDRVHEGADAESARDSLVADWAAARHRGETALMIAPRTIDAEDLNQRARRLLQTEGRLRADEIVFDRRPFTRGDDVMAVHNDYRVGVLNGTRAVLTGIDRRHRQLELTTPDGQQLRVPWRYAQQGHLRHGYATTIHKAQGATIDRCLILATGDGSREQLYTALSRGRYGNDLYLVNRDVRSEDRHAPEFEPEPVEELRRAAGRSAAQQLAIDHPPAQSPVDALRRQRDAIAARIGLPPPDVTRLHEQLQRQRQQAAELLDAAHAHRDHQAHQLDQLGAIGRHLRPSRRREHEQAVDRYDGIISDRRADLHQLDTEVAELQPALDEWSRWQDENWADLRRLVNLDWDIHLADTAQRLARRTPTPAVEQSLAVNQGLAVDDSLGL